MVKTKKSATITQQQQSAAAQAENNSAPAPDNNAVTTPNKEKDSNKEGAAAPPVVVSEPDNTVYVHRSKQTENIPSMSPDCLALETYLRMRKIPYQYASEKVVEKQHGEPVVTLNHKDYVGFDKIVEALTTLPPPVSTEAAPQENGGDHPSIQQVQQMVVTLAELTTADQQSDCQAYVMSLADIVLAYCLYNQRVKNSAPADFITRIKSSYRNIKSVFTKKEKENKDEEDRLTKLKPEQIVDVVKDSLKALNNRMQRSGGAYFFGDELTKHDAILFGVLAQYWKEPPTSSSSANGGGSQSTNDFLTIASLLEAEPDNRLVAYLENIKENFWPDWKERCAQPPPAPAPVTSPSKRGTFRKLRGDQSVTTPTDKTTAAADQSANKSTTAPPVGQSETSVLVHNGAEMTEKSGTAAVLNGEEKSGADQPLTNGINDGGCSPLAEKCAHLHEIPPINAE